jgi:uncharacterized protein
MQAQRRPLSDGRWHLQHGPIDIVLKAEGEAAAVAAAHAEVWVRFAGVLAELVAELPMLRRPVVEGACPLQGRIARRMWQACVPHRSGFITPMAAVAGAVAEELIACYRRPGVARAWVNDGGDIALHLSPGTALRIGLFADLAQLHPAAALRDRLHSDAAFEVRAEMPVRGVATSGWRGRSFSLGIADSVTVFARSAAEADAAATVVANAVNVADARILRRPASELKDDSDLGDIPVTVDVPPLEARPVHEALATGRACAEALRDAGFIAAAALVCQGWCIAPGEAAPRPLAGRTSAAIAAQAMIEETA